MGIPAEAVGRYPHAFSGGQRQRIGIARALVLDPKLVIADEAVSALDVSIQAQVLNLLEDLKAEFGLTYIFISHDLGVVNYIADRVVVMYLGHVVENAPTEMLFERPRHPYTELLLEALPIADPLRRKGPKKEVRGEIPYLGNRPAGCPFHTRCKYAEDRCRTDKPALRPINGTAQMAACHFAETLDLNGAYEDAPQKDICLKMTYDPVSANPLAGNPLRTRADVREGAGRPVQSAAALSSRKAGRACASTAPARISIARRRTWRASPDRSGV